LCSFLAVHAAISAIYVPGVCGAFLRRVHGMYEVTLEALNALDLAYVGVFILGAAVGLGLFSRLLHFLLDRYHDLTMAALLGLMAGSLRALWPWLSEDREILFPDMETASLVVLALAVLGFALVLGLTWIADRKGQMDTDLAWAGRGYSEGGRLTSSTTPTMVASVAVRSFSGLNGMAASALVTKITVSPTPASTVSSAAMGPPRSAPSKSSGWTSSIRFPSSDGSL